ncbi:type II toxin-antitoxin system VapB family antitoxin [Pelobium manganitolerans]|uniref:type II toxin-antitoxin system VapB family antitoxin n=1 Tax=Pelobium manganitolerans TaxID=1842495 RepID=UPI003FA3AD87
MTTFTLYKKLDALPADLKKQAIAYINELIKKGDNQKKTRPMFGALKGKIKLAEDFDEPLDIFKDYM